MESLKDYLAKKLFVEPRQKLNLDVLPKDQRRYILGGVKASLQEIEDLVTVYYQDNGFSETGERWQSAVGIQTHSCWKREEVQGTYQVSLTLQNKVLLVAEAYFSSPNNIFSSPFPALDSENV